MRRRATPIVAACLAVLLTPAGDRGAARANPAPAATAAARVLAAQGLGEPVAEGRLDSALERVLDAREYRRLIRRSGGAPPSWLEEFLKSFFGKKDRREVDLGSWDFSFGLAGFVITVVVYGLIAAVVLLVVALVVKSLVDRRRHRTPRGLERDPDDDGRLDLSRPPGEEAAEAYLERALNLAGGGDYRAAIREILLGCMSWAERSGLIRYRKGLTNRDYLRALRQQPDRRQALAVIARDFEEVFFGRRDATPERFDRCLDEFRTRIHGPDPKSALED